MQQQNQRKEIRCRDRKALRSWLMKNHTQQETVWLIIHKSNSTTGTLTYNDAVEEGLCFGWIDSKPNKLDDETYKLTFGPRRPKSGWSKVNKQKIKLLIENGLMQPSGLARIEEAKKDGSWNALDAIENMEVPAALQKALMKNRKAKLYFDAFPAGIKKQLYAWVNAAKTGATRDKRITDIVTKAAQNIRANQYVPKKS